MKSTFEKKQNEAVIRVALDAAEWAAEIDNAYNRTKGKYRVAGFRPGKAPRRFIEMHYGKGVFFEAAVDMCINRIYREQLQQHSELEVFGQPQVSFEKAEEGEAFAFTMTLMLYPDVKLGAYKGIKLPKFEYNVSDEDVDNRIKVELEQASRTAPSDKPAEMGDITVIDYVGTVNGIEFEGGKADNYELKLGSNAFIKGFEDGLIGAVKGEERDVKVKFPEEYHSAELKGKDAVFHVKVNDVLREEVPELTDDFVKSRGRYENVADYKAGTRKLLEQSAASHQRDERMDALMKAIAAASECDVPDAIINAELDRMYAEFERQVSSFGIKVEDYLKYNNSDATKFREERKERAARDVKIRRIMNEIIKAEKIEVNEEEVKQRLRDPNERARFTREAHEKGISAEESAYSEMLTDKIFDFLFSNNEFVLDDKKPEAEGEKKPSVKKASANKSGEKKSEQSAEA